MSTSPYSLDLREKVIKFVEKGNTQVEASKVFSLNISTINRWWLRYKKEGHYKPRVRLGAKAKIDVLKLEEYIEQHHSDRLIDIGKAFGVSLWVIQYWLKKLGYSYKKKRLPMWKRMRKNEINI